MANCLESLEIDPGVARQYIEQPMRLEFSPLADLDIRSDLMP
jgi:hypothetical protein